MSDVKARKIVIIYRNKDGYSFKHKKVFSKILNHQIKEYDRKPSTIDEDMAIFNDGTTIYSFPILKINELINKRATHIYIDDSIVELESWERFYNKVILPMMIEKGDYKKLDANIDIEHRIFVFNGNGNIFSL